MKLINTLTFIAVLIFTTGCALTTESIDIPYNLIQGVSKISGAVICQQKTGQKS
jgi:hypothetical protein